MRSCVLLAALAAVPSLAFTPPSFENLLKLFNRDSTKEHGLLHDFKKPLFIRRNETIPSNLGNVTQSQYIAAQAIVDEALDRVEEINRARFASPSRNHYAPRERGQQRGQRGKTAFTAQSQNELQADHFKMTKELKDAVALVSRIDALNDNQTPGVSGNKTFGPVEKRAAGTFWMETIARKGAWPWGKNPNHKVFRNVKDYGAKGDGVTVSRLERASSRLPQIKGLTAANTQDDTDAITKAIAEKDECSGGCYGSTTMGAIIYFPAGTYLIQNTIEISYGMQVIGDANNPPTLKSTKSFFGTGVLSTDAYWGDGEKGEDGRDHEYYINTANFHRQIRNFVIDTTQTTRPKAMAALHYQVAQATSLQNIVFKLSSDAGTEQIAIYAENGSGGFMSDLSFIAGKIGIWGGNQQFTAQRLSFINVRTAVEMIWDWGWMWKSITIENSHIGFNLTSGSGDGHVGSITVVDSVFRNVDIAVLVANANSSDTGRTSISMDNVLLDGVTTWLREQSGKNAPKDNAVPGNHKAIDMLTVGRSYVDSKLDDEKGIKEFASSRVDDLVTWNNPDGLPKLPYGERPKPQYEDRSASDFVHVKDSCKGDGVTDDTACFQKVLNDNINGKIVFVDAGTYILTDTVDVPLGSHIVGENWAQLAAYGPKFQDPKQPRVMLRIGRPGDVGLLDMQDLVFTSKGPTPGAVFVEWNVRNYKKQAGSAGMWDCHVRVGGAIGTGLTSLECPPSRSGINPNCQGGSMMMHITRQGGAYLENVWLWTADHDLDDPATVDNMNKMVQTSVYNARGFLIESINPTWLYGTASEHSVFYQYQFYKAANLVAGIIQTEQAYYQPTPKPPEPFKDAVGSFNGDPTFPCTDTEPCDEGWALRVIESSNIHIIGAGLYSWFDTYTQDCVPESNCQKVMTEFKNNHGGITINNLITIGATNMINADGKLIPSKDNLAVNAHPFWSDIVSYSPSGSARPGPAQPVTTPPDAELGDIVDRINSNLHEDCMVFPECVDMDNPVVSSCAAGYTRVGYDRGDCVSDL
ncbi:pectate lyase superfamily protein-domain-containing protein [Echria macrotheca]|uniref:Pectate lyase superfamily protein-domain-containing protein n=1 Tax=Echria macrotheca TaxID=438768 RepID=A0AAJ0B5D5_9PEZI|nr:pectate lyase superfamily protein-domain-containing protein [Echria macrotheca]